MKKILIPVGIVVTLLVAYFAGPKFDTPHLNNQLPELQLSINDVENYVTQIESLVDVKPDNGARIVWNNDSLKNKTEYCILYLHGFSASWYEGYPTHINVAKKIGANLYLSRLKAHGMTDPDAFAYMDPEGLYESAKEALIISKTLGEKVIVMGTSTGGTLALQLAADFPEIVHSLVLLSPNIAINNVAAPILSGHWGLQFARANGDGSLYRDLGPGLDVEHKYWYRKYRWEAVVFLQQLVEATMTKDVFRKVTQPVFLGYFYKSEEIQDDVVRVDAMLKMFDELSTPANLKYKIAFPNANNHVIGCKDLSGCSNLVETEILDYLSRML